MIVGPGGARGFPCGAASAEMVNRACSGGGSWFFVCVN